VPGVRASRSGDWLSRLEPPAHARSTIAGRRVTTAAHVLPVIRGGHATDDRLCPDAASDQPSRSVVYLRGGFSLIRP
jgi:hypothetical protein